MYHGYITGLEAMALVTGLVMVVTVWRLPTLIYALKHYKEVRKVLMSDRKGKLSEEAVEIFGANKEILTYAGGIVFFFKHWVKDLPYVPLYLLSLCTPWHSLKWTAAILKEPFVDSRQADHRHAIVKLMELTLYDLFTLLAAVLVSGTVWRLPFLITILKRNGHILVESNAVRLLHPLSARECLIRTFKEFLKDLPFVPFALLIMVATPWRIPRVVNTLTGFSMVFPRDNNFKELMSRRQELLAIALGKFIFDYLTILMIAVLLLTGWRAVTTIKIFKYHVQRVWAGVAPKQSLIQKMLNQTLQLLIDISMLVLMVFIVLLLVKLPQLYYR